MGRHTLQNNARERAEYPATRNRTRDHLIAAEAYSQMLYQLSYSRKWRSTVFQAIALQACYQGFTLDVMYVCVCVCLSGPLLCKGRGSRNQHHAFVLFRAFASPGAGPETKKNARH